MQIKALKTILKKQLNVKKTEELIEKMLDEVAADKYRQ